MHANPELDAHIEFQLSLLRLTAATAAAEKAPRAELWAENAQDLAKLAGHALSKAEEETQAQLVRVNKEL